MGVRHCHGCDQEFPLTAEFFHRAGSQGGGFQHRCKTCACKASTEYYRANQAKHRAWAKARTEDLAERVKAIKENTPCADCGNIFPAICMDFDHLDRSEKYAGISYMVQKGFAWVRVEAEIAKCELVCSNCHRIRTAATVNVRGTRTTPIPRRTRGRVHT